MDKLFNWISIIFGLIGGTFSYWMGGWDVLLRTIVSLAVVDYITGIIKGIYLKELSSEIGFKGLLKKIVMFIVIAVAFSIQELIGRHDTAKRGGYHVLHSKRSVESFGKCSYICTDTG